MERWCILVFSDISSFDSSTPYPDSRPNDNIPSLSRTLSTFVVTVYQQNNSHYDASLPHPMIGSFPNPPKCFRPLPSIAPV